MTMQLFAFCVCYIIYIAYGKHNQSDNNVMCVNKNICVLLSFMSQHEVF
jgi:hypothetical protein